MIFFLFYRTELVTFKKTQMIFFSPKGDTKTERNSKSQFHSKTWYDKFKPQIVILSMPKLQIHGEGRGYILKQLLQNFFQQLPREKQQKNLFPVIRELPLQLQKFTVKGLHASPYLAIIVSNMWDLTFRQLNIR